MSEFALFVVAPYVAVASLLAGTLRALLNHSRREPRVRPDVPFRIFARGHRLLPVGLLGVALGHVAIVGWPSQLANWGPTLDRLLLLEILLFLFGLAALVGLTIVVGRHAVRARHAIRVIDVAFVGALLVAVVSGLAVALLYRWAAAWSSVTLAPYVRSVATLQPDLRFLESMPYLVKLHLFSSSALIALVPFTTPMRMCLSAASHAIERPLTPIGAAVGRKWEVFREWARQSGRNLLWSEHDEYE